MMKSLKILVTGGAGYLGSVLVSALLEEGHRVTVIDNFMYSQTSLNQHCINPNFKVVNGDVRDEALMKPLASEFDVVIPLAAYVGAPLCDRDPTGAISTNLESVRALCGWLGKEQRILMPVSNSGYGAVGQGKVCDETTPMKPVSLYGRTKAEAEDIVMERENSISFRFATVFGISPRMRIDLLVNDFVYRAVHDRAVVLFEANFKRSYIHVQDVARVFLHGLARFSSMRGESYNVGLPDANLSKLELCTRIKTFLPSFVFMEAPIGEDPDKRDYITSTAKILATGYQPKHNLEKGIQELIKGYAMLRNTVMGNV